MSPSARDDESEVRRPRTDWRRVADGVGLAGVGVFLLVATVRGLPDGFWIDAVAFWPVLLVSAGIRIVFEKTPLAAGMVLGPLVVVGTLFWLAWGERPKPLPPGEWHEVTAAMPQSSDRATVHAELAGVHLGLGVRSLGPALLAEGRAASRVTTPRLDLDDREGAAQLRLRGRHSGFMVVGRRREVWDVNLSDALPLEFDLSGAFNRGDLDLRRGWVTDAEVHGAFNDWTLRLPPPSQPVRLQFQGAFSSFTVKVPKGTAVRYEGPGFPIVWLDKGPARDEIGEDAPGYHVVVEGAFAVVNIEEAAAPEGGWPAARPPVETAAAEHEESEETLEEARPPAEAEPSPPAEDPTGG